MLALALVFAVVSGDITCKVTSVLGCFYDGGDDNRTLPFTAAHQDAGMSQEYCARLCAQFNFSLNAVEYGDQCFCGNSYTYTPIREPDGDCQKMRCAGDKSQWCGDADRMLVFRANCSGTVTPNGHACLDDASRALPFCNPALPTQQRLDDLMARLTHDEMMGMLGADTKHTGVDACSCMTAGVARLGIPNYMQIVETNSDVASACVTQDRCGTNWVGPNGLAASFNRTSWHLKGVALSDEMRAFNNLGWFRGMGPAYKIGLLGYGPNINIVRDPRFGRNSELPSEDPYLTGSYAVQYVSGCQVGPDRKYLKMTSGLKHYACYSVENNRAGRNFAVSAFDLFDTYLPQYKMAFSSAEGGGNAQAVMCSYASVNGVPMCANDYLINKVVRGAWNRSDVLVGTDCGAINNMVHYNKYAANDTMAAAVTINGGSDTDLGDMFFSPVANGGNGALADAIARGKVTWETVATSARRTLEKRFRVGLFDPINSTAYTKIGLDVINSTLHQQINLEAALQSFVLLKNARNTLPFKLGGKLAVVGPHVYSTRDLMEDYKGDEDCYGGGDGCVTTIAQAFTAANGAANTHVVEGVDLYSTNAAGIPAALDAVRAADAVVLAIGLGNGIEHEGLDRTFITLPGIQDQFAQQVLQIGKPTVVVLINGGAVAIDNLVPIAPAIIEAFYPSVKGAKALTQAIFGQANWFGRLSYTIYPANFTNEVDMYNFDMSKPPGRTYRYYTGFPLFKFGYGLSYSTYTFDCSIANGASTSTLSCSTRNTGSRAGQNILQVYHRISDTLRSTLNHPAPIKTLVDFERVAVAVGDSSSVSFTLPWSRVLVLTNSFGDKVLYPGLHYFDVWDGSDASPLSFAVTVSGTAAITVEPAPRDDSGFLA